VVAVTDLPDEILLGHELIDRPLPLAIAPCDRAVQVVVTDRVLERQSVGIVDRRRQPPEAVVLEERLDVVRGGVVEVPDGRGEVAPQSPAEVSKEGRGATQVRRP
jgi:hypothetical protein